MISNQIMKVHRFVDTKKFFIILQLRYISYIVLEDLYWYTNQHSYFVAITALSFPYYKISDLLSSLTVVCIYNSLIEIGNCEEQLPLTDCRSTVGR